MGNFTLWLKTIRPQTLFASLTPVLVGLYSVGVQDFPVALLTAICALTLQILSNLINDYYDFRRGADKSGRIGFKRALAEGLISEKQMLRACVVAAILSVATGAFLVYKGGCIILLIGLSALLFAWLYTATSHSLSYLGIADIFVFLYYGVVASSGTAFLQIHAFSWTAFYAGAVCGLISMSVLMVNNLRDIEDDRGAGKRTLPVRFGKTFALCLLFVEVMLTPVFAYLAFGFSPAMLIIVPALLLYFKILRSRGAEYNKCLLLCGLTNVCYFLLCIVSSV